jgi:hypothetical protein
LELALMLMGISIVLFVPISYIIFGDIHEGGHALACLARGGHVGGFGGWLRGILPLANRPATNCSIDPIPAPVWAAGALTSIISWFASAFIVILLLDAAIIKPAFCAGSSGVAGLSGSWRSCSMKFEMPMRHPQSGRTARSSST